MKIYKETEIKHPLYTATIDNGIMLLVFDGYALGSDGKKYLCVMKENEDGDSVFIGWRQC